MVCILMLKPARSFYGIQITSPDAVSCHTGRMRLLEWGTLMLYVSCHTASHSRYAATQ